MALGAQTGQIAKRFVANAALLVLLGVALGATAAVSMGRALASLLFGVSPADVVTIVGAALLLGVVAMVASIGPALAATRSSPSELLK
jgi:ABC-type antimicrobial peptide transport system permease subunit